jgi:hypothetical protein
VGEQRQSSRPNKGTLRSPPPQTAIRVESSGHVEASLQERKGGYDRLARRRTKRTT